MIALLILQAASAVAAPPPSSTAEPPSRLYRLVGHVAPRTAAQMRAAGVGSSLSIGTETTDRNYSRYENWRAYLGPLGIPRARVQTGWADVERIRGRFDFGKLERMVLGMKADGVEPWFDLNYGNGLYEGGGGAELGAGLPVPGTPGHEGWRRFVRETVRHFSHPDLRVTTWQIWNEPDGGPNTATDYTAFAAETARLIKEVQPEATILLAGFTGEVFDAKAQYALDVVDGFAAATRGLVAPGDVRVVYHPYAANPDESYGAPFARLRAAAARHGYVLEQGENGTNSQAQQHFALREFPWTETSQAKWALRRLLGDVHRGIRTNLFTLTDLHYARSKNNKGLLLTGAWAPDPPTFGDQRVQRPKVAYRAVQALSAVFDDRLRPIGDGGCRVPAGYTVQAWGRGNARLLAVWRSTDRPGADERTADIEFTCSGQGFSLGTGPLDYVDLLPGRVYRASGVARSRGRTVVVKGLRVYDSPVLLGDGGIVPVAQ